MSPVLAVLADSPSPHVGLSLVLLLICAAGAWAMQRNHTSSGSKH